MDGTCMRDCLFRLLRFRAGSEEGIWQGFGSLYQTCSLLPSLVSVVFVKDEFVYSFCSQHSKAA